MGSLLLLLLGLPAAYGILAFYIRVGKRLRSFIGLVIAANRLRHPPTRSDIELYRQKESR